MTEAPTSEVVLGVAKKMNAELEKMPIHSHGTVLHMLGGLLQHRQISEKVEHDQKLAAMQQEAMKRQQDQESLRRSGLVLAQ